MAQRLPGDFNPNEQNVQDINFSSNNYTEPSVDEGRVASKTLRDLLPLLATIGATGIGYAAGARGDKLAAIPAIFANTAGRGIQAYQRNKEEAKYDLASKIVDSYVDIQDPNEIYKRFRMQNPKLASEIDLGELYRRKAAETNTIIDLRGSQYKNQKEADEDFDVSDRQAFLNDGFVQSFDEKRHRSMDYSKKGFSSLLGILDQFTGDFSKDGAYHFTFKDSESYQKFINEAEKQGFNMKHVSEVVASQDPLKTRKLDIEEAKLQLRRSEIENAAKRLNARGYSDYVKLLGLTLRHTADASAIPEVYRAFQNISNASDSVLKNVRTSTELTEFSKTLSELQDYITKKGLPLESIQNYVNNLDEDTGDPTVDSLLGILRNVRTAAGRVSEKIGQGSVKKESQKRIKVKNKAGQTGTILESDFDPDKYERIK